MQSLGRVERHVRSRTPFWWGKKGSASWRIAFGTAIVLLVLQILGSSESVDAASSQMLRMASVAFLGFLPGVSIISITGPRDGGDVNRRWEAVAWVDHQNRVKAYA